MAHSTTRSSARSRRASSSDSSPSDVSFTTASSGDSAQARLLGGECWEGRDTGEASRGGALRSAMRGAMRGAGAAAARSPGISTGPAPLTPPEHSQRFAPGFSSTELLRRYVEAGASDGTHVTPGAQCAPRHLGEAGAFAVPPSPPSPFGAAKQLEHLADAQPLSPSPVRVLTSAGSVVGALEEACAEKTPDNLTASSSFSFSDGDALSLGPVSCHAPLPPRPTPPRRRSACIVLAIAPAGPSVQWRGSSPGRGQTACGSLCWLAAEGRVSVGVCN
jgi:hypothetical protein|eukprot:Tamp_23466.p1 GENE.Tamp_23466~~Tamp_23466.p1  ORF type:complete len:295 (+),score=34.83 Tamp_23466:58-885(+)